MASLLKTSKVATGVQARNVNDLTSVYAEYNLAAALVVDDIIQMVKVPKGAVVQEIILAVDALDSSTGVSLDVGFGGAAAATVDKFIAAVTIGQSATAGIARLTAVGGVNYAFTAEDTIDVRVKAAPSGTASTTGKIRMTVIYTNQF